MRSTDSTCDVSATAAAQIAARRHAGAPGSAPRDRVTAHVTLAYAVTPASASSVGTSAGNNSPSGFTKARMMAPQNDCSSWAVR